MSSTFCTEEKITFLCYFILWPCIKIFNRWESNSQNKLRLRLCHQTDFKYK